MKTRNTNRAIRALTTGLALIAGTTLPSTALADAQENQHFNIEVIVNVLKGTDVTNEKIRDYFEIANQALKCAKINLQILEINENVELGDDNDAIGEDEFDDARTTGTDELDDPERGDNRGKGLKVYFADDVREERPNTNGWAYVCEPFGAVENFMDPDATAEQLCQEVGNILAHEVGHMLGIPGGATPDDDGVDGDYTDAERKNELMNGWSHRDCDGERTIRGTDLTDAQKARIRCKAGERGTAVIKEDEQTPAERDRTEQSGGAINPADSSVPGAPGIRKVSLFSDSFEPCFELSLITRGVFDPTDFAQYTVALDIDNDPATGQPFGPLQGADRRIDITVEGFGGAFAQGFDLNNPDAPPLFLDLGMMPADFVSDGPENFLLPPLPNGEAFDLCIPRPWLGVDPGLAPVVPVFVQGFDQFGPTDQLEFPLDLERGLRGPELIAPPFIEPDLPLPIPPLPIEGRGFPPGGLVEVEIQELGLQGVIPVGLDGEFQLDLPLPPGVVLPSDFLYVTALDPVAKVTAFTVIDLPPPNPPCNPADIAPPFGVLDLGDVDAFITAFTNGDLSADLAPPFGVLDLDDVDAFIAAFFAGCP